jgi:hypothetical protein
MSWLRDLFINKPNDIEMMAIDIYIRGDFKRFMERLLNA